MNKTNLGTIGVVWMCVYTYVRVSGDLTPKEKINY